MSDRDANIRSHSVGFRWQPFVGLLVVVAATIGAQGLVAPASASASASLDSAHGHIVHIGNHYGIAWTLHHECLGTPAFGTEEESEGVTRCESPWFEVVNVQPASWGECPGISRAIGRIFVSNVEKLGGPRYPSGGRELIPRMGTRRIRICYYVNAEFEEFVAEQRFLLGHDPR